MPNIYSGATPDAIAISVRVPRDPNKVVKTLKADTSTVTEDQGADWTWKFFVLPNDISIEMEHHSPIFNQDTSEAFSQSISIPVEGNRHIIGNTDDIHGGSLYDLLYGKKFRLYVKGAIRQTGIIHLDNQVSFEDGKFEIEFCSGRGEFKDALSNLNCRDVDISNDKLELGYYVDRTIEYAHYWYYSNQYDYDGTTSTSNRRKIILDLLNAYLGNKGKMSWWTKNKIPIDTIGDVPYKFVGVVKDWEKIGKSTIESDSDDWFDTSLTGSVKRSVFDGASMIVYNQDDAMWRMVHPYDPTNRDTKRQTAYTFIRRCFQSKKPKKMDENSTEWEDNLQKVNGKWKNVYDTCEPKLLNVGLVPCFYVAYFLDKLFEHLRYKVESNCMEAYEDWFRMTFVNGEMGFSPEMDGNGDVQRYKYNRETKKVEAISADKSDTETTYLGGSGINMCESNGKQCIDWDKCKTGGIVDSDNKYKDDCSAGGLLSVIPCVGDRGSNSWPPDDWYEKDPLTGETVEKKFWGTLLLGQTDIYGVMHKAIANADNFPDASTQDVIEALEAAFNIRFNYNAKTNTMKIISVNDIFKNNNVTPLEAKITKMIKSEYGISGYRLKYSPTDVETIQKALRTTGYKYGGDNSDARYNYVYYEDGSSKRTNSSDATSVTGASNNGAKSLNTSIDTATHFCEKRNDTLSGYDMTCYIDKYTGNAYRVRVNGDATSVAGDESQGAVTLHPVLFQVGDLIPVEVGDCTKENDDLGRVKEVEIGFEPIDMNVIESDFGLNYAVFVDDEVHSFVDKDKKLRNDQLLAHSRSLTNENTEAFDVIFPSTDDNESYGTDIGGGWKTGKCSCNSDYGYKMFDYYDFGRTSIGDQNPLVHQDISFAISINRGYGFGSSTLVSGADQNSNKSLKSHEGYCNSYPDYVDHDGTLFVYNGEVKPTDKMNVFDIGEHKKLGWKTQELIGLLKEFSDGGEQLKSRYLTFSRKRYVKKEANVDGVVSTAAYSGEHIYTDWSFEHCFAARHVGDTYLALEFRTLHAKFDNDTEETYRVYAFTPFTSYGLIRTAKGYHDAVQSFMSMQVKNGMSDIADNPCVGVFKVPNDTEDINQVNDFCTYITELIMKDLGMTDYARSLNEIKEHREVDGRISLKLKAEKPCHFGTYDPNEPEYYNENRPELGGRYYPIDPTYNDDGTVSCDSARSRRGLFDKFHKAYANFIVNCKRVELEVADMDIETLVNLEWEKRYKIAGIVGYIESFTYNLSSKGVSNIKITMLYM